MRTQQVLDFTLGDRQWGSRHGLSNLLKTRLSRPFEKLGWNHDSAGGHPPPRAVNPDAKLLSEASVKGGKKPCAARVFWRTTIQARQQLKDSLRPAVS